MIFIQVVVPGTQVQEIEPVLAQCCNEAGDALLGREHIQDINEWLFLVQLQHEDHLSKHLPILSHALEHKAIASFEFVQGSLVSLASPGVREQMESFPLSLGDCWVTAINDMQCIFLCCHRPLLTPKQSAWLLLHQDIQWNYI